MANNKYKINDYIIDNAIDRGVLCIWKVVSYNEEKDQYILSTEIDESFSSKEYGYILISKRTTVESSTRLTGRNWNLLYGR